MFVATLCLVQSLWLVAGADEPPPTQGQWHVSAQLGGGRVEGDPAGVFRPRIGWHSGNAEISLSAPLWLRISDLPPYGERLADGGGPPDTPAPGWLRRWDQPESWATVLERLVFESETLNLFVGTLARQSLGYGGVLDRYEGWLDPVRQRTGARLDMKLRHLDLEMSTLLDSVVNPRIFGISTSLAPLQIFSADPTRRFHVSVDGVTDVRAPTLDAEGKGTERVAAASANASVAVWRGQNVGVETFVVAAASKKGSLGAHWGWTLEAADAKQRNTFRLRLEAIRGSTGYTPGYFDTVYEAERLAVPADNWVPKSSIKVPANWWLKGTADFVLGPTQFGVATRGALDARTVASFYAQLTSSDVTATVAWVRRAIYDAASIVKLDADTYIVFDAALQLFGGTYGFTSIHHGWRRDPAGDLRVVADWMIGIGWLGGGPV